MKPKNTQQSNRFTLYIICWICSLVFLQQTGFSQSYQWHTTLNDTQDGEYAWFMDMYDDQRVVNTGRFYGSVIIGNDTLISISATCWFVNLLDTTGNPIWARQMHSGFAYINDVKTGPDGYIYVLMTYETYIDTIPDNIYNSSVPAQGMEDFALFKIDVNGNKVWTRTWGGAGKDMGKAIAVDAQGNVYVGGYHTQNLDFDPGPGSVTYTPINEEAFVIKLDAGGNFSWVKNYPVSGFSQVNELEVSPSGNLLVGLDLQGNCNLDPNGLGFIVTQKDEVLIQYDAAGNFNWAVPFSGNTMQGKKIGFQPNGDIIWITSFYSPDPMYIYSTAQNLTDSVETDNVIYSDIAVLRFSPQGNYLQGALLGGVSNENFNSAQVDAGGNIHIAMAYIASLDVDPGPDTLLIYPLTSSGTVYIGLDASLNYVSHIQFETTNYDTHIRGVAVGNAGDLYLGYEIYGDTDVDPAGTQLLEQPSGFADIVLSRINLCRPAVIQSIQTDPVLCFNQFAQVEINGNLNDAMQWNWYLDSCAGSPFATGNQLSVQLDSIYTVYARPVGGCSQHVNCEVVLLQPEFMVYPIGGAVASAPGQTEIYTVQVPQNGTVNWSVTSGTILTGQGTGQIAVIWGQAALGTLVCTYTSPNCAYTDSLEVHLQGLGTDVSVGDFMSVYPNPAMNIIHLQAEKFVEAVEWIDAFGRIAGRQEVNGFTTALSCQDWCAGYYTLKVYQPDGITYTKVQVISR